MNIWNLVTSSLGGIVASFGDAIDKNVTSDEERAVLKNALATITSKFELALATKANEFEQEITKRWDSDNQADSLLTRSYRPVTYIYVLIMFTFIIFFDGNVGDFTIKNAYIPVIETLLATMTIAIFGSRGIEKTMRHFRKK